ncbi:hypothetical protein BASA60_000371 [Batrachochytrium salamandrivorans]|nr:hypothetical protein BASA60_000371 [Batrachochytrium salamandrivorans]
MKVSFVSILTTAALFISTVQCTGYSLWSAERRSGRVTFIPYTQQQRESVMGNIDRMMKMWVNSDSKQIHYDGKANPYPDLDIFRETYTGMTDEQFSLGLAKIFNKMRDRHTLFYKSGPYGCFSVSTGLFFKFVDDSLVSSTSPKVRVVGMNDTPEVLDLIGDVISTVALGDELLTVNGLSFDDWYEQNKFGLGFGANDSGGHSGAFKYLAGISGSSNILPEDDDITFQLRRLGGNQELYTVTIPYVAFYNDECWDLSSDLYKELTGITLPRIPAPTSYRYKRSVSVNGASVSGNSISHRQDTNIHKRSYWDSVYFETTDIDGLTWTIWRNGERNMGVIKIESFILVLKNTKKYTTFLFLALTIRNLLVDQLKDTDSIVFDIRGNDGGSISGADGIIQLFKPDVTASQFRYLKNEVTRDIFYKGLSSKNPWSKAWDATSDTSRYSGLVSLYDSSILNTLGQVYFNPVGVYTDGACYSACEVFAAHIQDHSIGTVFGEDEATSGGGASIFFSDEHYLTNRPLEHRMDPFTKKLTGKNPSHKFYTRVSVGVRQLVRSGNYAGQLIEDNGVKSEVIVRSTIDDILPGDTGTSAYDCMADYLGDVAKRQADSKVYFISEPYDIVTSDESIDIPFVVSGVDEIIVVHQGKKLGKWEGKSSTIRQDHVITVKTPTGLHNHLITFIGTKRGKQMFKTHRQIIRMPTSDDQVSMMTANSYTVSGPSASVGVYSFGSTLEQEGWDFNNGKWILGDGMSDYYGYMYSIIQVWLTAPVGSTISVSIDAIVDTYEDGGVFSLNMMDDSDEIVPMVSSPSKDGLIQSKSTTGRNQVIKGTYSFTVTTENFALGLKFVSYNAESPFSIKFNSIVITKDQGIFNWLNRHIRRYFKP